MEGWLSSLTDNIGCNRCGYTQCQTILQSKYFYTTCIRSLDVSTLIFRLVNIVGVCVLPTVLSLDKLDLVLHNVIVIGMFSVNCEQISLSISNLWYDYNTSITNAVMNIVRFLKILVKSRSATQLGTLTIKSIQKYKNKFFFLHRFTQSKL